MGSRLIRASGLQVGNANRRLTTLEQRQSEPWTGVAGGVGFGGLWVDFSAALAVEFFKNPLGEVWISGAAKTGVVGTRIFTLPAGYWPKKDMHFACYSNAAFGGFVVQAADGQVISIAGSNVMFALNCSFRVA